jgi:hypothetical protein
MQRQARALAAVGAARRPCKGAHGGRNAGVVGVCFSPTATHGTISQPCPHPPRYWGCNTLEDARRAAAAAASAAAPAEPAPAAPQQPQQPPAAAVEAPAAPQPRTLHAAGFDPASEPVSAPAPAFPHHRAAARPEAPIEVGMQFPGVSTEEFHARYAAPALAAVARVAGVDAAAVEQRVAPAGARRRLLQAGDGPPPRARVGGYNGGSGYSGDDDGVEVTYSITSPNRQITLERVEAAAANDGAGFAEALAAAGVPLRPAVTVLDGAPRTPRLRTARVPAGAAGAAPAAPAPPPRPPAGVVAGAVVGSLLGALLLVALAAFFVVSARRRRDGLEPPLAALFRHRERASTGGTDADAPAPAPKE